MKTKRLIILISVIAVIVLLVVLNSTVFTLKKVEINFYDKNDQLIEDNNTLTHFDQSSIQQIISSADFKFGKNMFLIKKKPYIDALEKNNAYLKVIDITSVFPNKLVVKVVEREDFYSVNLDNGKYAILDGELKVLNIVDSLDKYSTISSSIDVDNVEIGSFINFTDEQKILKQVQTYLYNCTFDTPKAIAFIEGINVNFDYMTDNPTQDCLWLNIQTRKTNALGDNVAGVKLSIENASLNLEEKIYKALEAYNTCLQEDLSKTQSGTIKVFNNLQTIWQQE